MKKIVALVLSLVMVLGLATTAFAVDYDVYNKNGTLVEGGTTYTINDATPVVDGEGVVEHVTLGCWLDAYFVECDKVDADYYLTIEDQDDAIMYVKEVKEVEYTVAKAFTNLGSDCGELNVSKKYDYYYTANDQGDQFYWKAEKDLAAAATAALLVDGELIQVSSAGNETDLVPHDWEIKTLNDDHEVTSIVCDDCGVVATVYESKLAAPKGAIEDATYGWIAFVAADAPAADAETDKVESAETFDAGIAMYVGMSVMAAAGSAVVLKKKD